MKYWQALEARFELLLDKLSERDRTLALASSMLCGLLLLVVIVVSLAGSIHSAEKRVRTKSKQLTEVLALQGGYKERESAEKNQLQKIKRSTIRLVAYVEEAATFAGVKIEQLQPDEASTKVNGIVESTVSLRANELSIDRLQKFLVALSKESDLVFISRLEVERPYRSTRLNIEMTLATYREKS